MDKWAAIMLIGVSFAMAAPAIMSIYSNQHVAIACVQSGGTWKNSQCSR